MMRFRIMWRIQTKKSSKPNLLKVKKQAPVQPQKNNFCDRLVLVFVFAVLVIKIQKQSDVISHCWTE